MFRSMFWVALSSCVLSAGCSPFNFLGNVPGFTRAESMPEPTTNGDEPVMYGTNIVRDGNHGYIEFIHSGTATHVFIELQPQNESADPETFLVELSEVQAMDICGWIDRQWSEALMGMSLYSCSQACADACNCYSSCSDLPADLGIIGGPNMLCTAACSQADSSGAGLTATEFADTFGDIYGCEPSSCNDATQFISNYVEIKYDIPDIGAGVSQPVVAPPGTGMSNGDAQSASISVGQRRGCIVY